MSFQMQPAPQTLRKRRQASKKKREYDRLREEYERIKELEDRNIEMKMRQVRLNRLFREIEEIKERTALNVRRQQERAVTKPKTPEDLRKESIQRSKQLGIEYSKMNALLYNSFGHGYLLSGRTHKRQTREISGYEKRIRYGNAISRHNYVQLLQMQSAQQRRAKETSGRVKDNGELSTDASNSEVHKSEKLRSRLVYGNTQSYINILKIVQNQKRQGVQRTKSLPSTSPQWLNSSDEDTQSATTATDNIETTNELTTALRTDDSSKAATKFVGGKAHATALCTLIKMALKALQDMNFESVEQELGIGPTSDKDVGTEKSLCAIPSETQVSEYFDDIDAKQVHSSDSSVDENDETERLIMKNVYEQAPTQAPKQAPKQAPQPPKQELRVPTAMDSQQPRLFSEKLLPTSTSAQFHNIFKTSEKPVGSGEKHRSPIPPTVPAKPTGKLFANPAGMQLEKIFKANVQDTVMEQVMGNKVLRSIFEH